MQRPVYLCRPPHGTTPINTYILSSGMSGTIWYLQSLSLRKNLAGNACVDFSIWFPRPDPRRGRLEAARLVGRIILDPPIQRLNRSIGRSGLLRSANSLLRRPRAHRPYQSLGFVPFIEATSEMSPLPKLEVEGLRIQLSTQAT